jgi:hypothetical protein
MEELLGLFITLIVFAAIFGVVYIVITARNKERMAMIDKGVNPKDFMVQRKPQAYSILKWALLLAGVGLGLFVGSLLVTYTGIDEEPAYFACALLFGGSGLAAAFFITRKAEHGEN